VFVLGSFNESTKLELVTTDHFMVHIRLEADVVFIGSMERTRVLDIKFLGKQLTQSYWRVCLHKPYLFVGVKGEECMLSRHDW
jgi:hypothetical protein